MPSSSMRSRILLIPTFFAFPHSEACSDTSMPVGRSPRKAAMTSQEPSGISTRKKAPISARGAGLTKYTARVDTTMMAARILAEFSTAL